MRRAFKIAVVVLFLIILVFSIRSQELQKELEVWDLPVDIEKSEEGYKVIDSEATSFTEAAFSISYLMTSLEYVIEDNDINPNFQIEYLFIDGEGQMWELHISRLWLNNYLQTESRSVKEDMIKNLMLPYTEEQRVQQYQQLEDRIKSLR